MDVAGYVECPSCGGALDCEDEAWTCRSCGCGYRYSDGIADLTPSDACGMTLSERDHYTEKLGYYLEMHETWRESPFYRHYHGEFLDDLRALPRGSLILELGCGLGHDGLELLRSGHRLVETDVAPGELAEARRLQRGGGHGDRAEHMLVDAQHLPFADDTFDGVFMVAALHHLPDPAKALGEAVRVLAPGGVLVLGTEPNTWQHRTIFPLGKVFLRLVYRVLGREADPGEMVSEADKETEGFSRRDLEHLLKGAGFASWELKPAGFVSAAFFFIGQEVSEHFGRTVRLFRLERAGVAVDGWLARLGLLKRYPWHWNALARKG